MKNIISNHKKHFLPNHIISDRYEQNAMVWELLSPILRERKSGYVFLSRMIGVVFRKMQFQGIYIQTMPETQPMQNKCRKGLSW